MNEEIILQLKKIRELKAENFRLKKEILKTRICFGYEKFWIFTLLGLGRIIGDWPKWLDNWHYKHYLKVAKKAYEIDPKQAMKNILENNTEETIERLLKDLGINQNRA